MTSAWAMNRTDRPYAWLKAAGRRATPAGETVCVACGQGFDAEEEQELRHRDRAAQRCDTPRVNAGKGYLVG